MSGYQESPAASYKAKRSKPTEAKRERDSNTNYVPQANGHDPNWERARDVIVLGKPPRPPVFPPEMVDHDDLLKTFKRPRYVINGLLPEASFGTFTGHNGHGKTMTALLMAYRIVTGGWFCGRKCRAGNVVIMAGENPTNMMQQLLGILHKYGPIPESCPYRLKILPGRWEVTPETIEAAKATLSVVPDLRLIIWDSLQEFSNAEDENSNTDVIGFVNLLKSVSDGHVWRPASVILAHPSKAATKDSLVARGASSVGGAIDFNLTAWKQDDLITLHHGKVRDSGFSPINLREKKVWLDDWPNKEPDDMDDDEQDEDKRGKMPSAYIVHVGNQEVSELLQMVNDLGKAILRVLSEEGNGEISLRELAAEVSHPRTSVDRALKDLLAKKLITEHLGVKLLTSVGRRIVEALQGVEE